MTAELKEQLQIVLATGGDISAILSKIRSYYYSKVKENNKGYVLRYTQKYLDLAQACDALIKMQEEPGHYKIKLEWLPTNYYG